MTDIAQPKARLATPTDARAIAALFRASGARPNEIDGAVLELIELSKNIGPPTCYEDIAQQAEDALAAYRSRSEVAAEQ